MTSQLIQKAVEKLEKEKTDSRVQTRLDVDSTERVQGYNIGITRAQSLLPQIITGVIEEVVNKLQYRIDVNHLVKDMDIVSPQEIVDLTQDELINTLKEVVKE